MDLDGSAEARATGIACIAQPVRAMGEAAAGVLLAAMCGKLPGLVQRVFAPSLQAGAAAL